MTPSSYVTFAILTLLSLMDASQLWKNRLWGKLAVLVVIVLVGDTTAILLASGHPLPNPMDGVILLFQPVTDWLNRLLT
jgi:hypothetical protein